MSGSDFVFEDVACGYADTLVVRGISGRVGAGEVLGVLGRNGVGKSTLMKALAGFLPLARGRVFWRGGDIGTAPPHARLGAGLAFAPQENVVFGELSVDDNLWLHLRGRRDRRYAELLQSFPRIEERLRQRAGALSGGERKLLSFVRTMGLGAPLTLFDESTEGVQPENIEKMARAIAQRATAGASFIVVEQNLGFLESIASRVLVMDHGECVLEGAMAGLSRETLERHLVV